MATTSTQIDQFLAESRLALENAHNPQIQAHVAAYGLDPDALEEGLALIEKAEEAARTSEQEYKDKKIATQEHREAMAVFDARYRRHVKLLRTAFRSDSAATVRLGLSGERPRTQADLLKAARSMYDTLQASPELQAVATDVNVGPDAVQAMLDAYDELFALERVRKEEKAEAENATSVRNDAVATARGWMRDFWDITEIALEPQPQLKEMLGRTAPSR
jgi:hypothetical protein